MKQRKKPLPCPPLPEPEEYETLLKAYGKSSVVPEGLKAAAEAAGDTVSAMRKKVRLDEDSLVKALFVSSARLARLQSDVNAFLKEAEARFPDEPFESHASRASARLVNKTKVSTAALGGLTAVPGTLPGVGTAGTLMLTFSSDLFYLLRSQYILCRGIAMAFRVELPEERMQAVALSLMGFSFTGGKNTVLDDAFAKAVDQAADKYLKMGLRKAVKQFLNRISVKASTRFFRLIPLVGIPIGALANVHSVSFVGERAERYFNQTKHPNKKGEMMTQGVQTDNIVLKGIASTLNGFGRLMVAGYDLGAAGPKAACQMIRNASRPGAGQPEKTQGDGEETPKAYQREVRKQARQHEKEFSQIIEDLEHAIKAAVQHMTVEEVEALEPVILDLFDHDMEIKTLAAVYLGEAGNPHTLPILDAALGFENPALTDAVVTALYRIDPGCIDPVLNELVQSTDQAIRLTALNHLDKINSPEAGQACLAALLEDEVPEVREAAEKLTAPAAPEAPDAPDPDEKSLPTTEALNRMVKPDLVAMGKSLELNVSLKMKKDEIIQAILDHSSRSRDGEA